MNIIESFTPTAATLGGVFFVCILIGYALKKLIKLVALIVGLFLVGLAYNIVMNNLGDKLFLIVFGDRFQKNIILVKITFNFLAHFLLL